MKVLNVHERRIARPLGEVFGELAALGTERDRIWPEPRMPLRRTPGPMRVGTTRERHGGIRAVLESYQENTRIVWRVDLPFLRGTHAFEVRQLGQGSTLVRHTVDARLPWWFAPVWRLRIAGLHDRILEALLDRLAAPAETG
ncbi:MAG: SRPBCC family protein [Nevskia sp.]|nr:SRPBCC family protein [Nevskia sp.]